MRFPASWKGKFYFLRHILPFMARSVLGNFVSLRSVRLNPSTPRQKMNPEFLAKVERHLKKMGASAVGYTKLDSNYIFDHTAILYENAIVLAQEMDEEAINLAPDIQTEAMVHKVYADLGGIANKLAFFLRLHGYGAHASHALRGTVVFPPLAQLANLGIVGKNGMLLTEPYGSRVRLAIVFTSIENLPFADPEDNPHAWMRDFCDHCNRCVHNCPAQALMLEPIVQPGGALTYVDNTKCFPYFKKNYGCAVCIKECPFSQSGSYTSLKKAFERRKRKEAKRSAKKQRTDSVRA